MIRTLPLGVDIGSAGIRVAAVERAGTVYRLRAVASREWSGGSPSYAAAVIADAVRELQVRERRCCCALVEPDAELHPVRFPPMSRWERARAAAIEARRRSPFGDDTVVRLHPADGTAEGWAVGVARRSALRERVAALRACGLRPTAVEHEANAVFRAFRSVDAAVDIGADRTLVHVNLPVPRTIRLERGGSAITAAIARDLAIDVLSAERRKRIVGTAGAGEPERRLLVDAIAQAIARARFMRSIESIVLLGNGSRLPSLTAELETAAGVRCEIPIDPVIRAAELPEDVLRSAYVDWGVACGLALREAG